MVLRDGCGLCIHKQGQAVNRPEQSLHIAVAEFLHAVLDPCVAWTAVETSQNKGTRADQAIAKTRGVRRGWPDLQMFWMEYGLYDKRDSPQWCFIELKRPEIREPGKRKGTTRIVQRAGTLELSQVECHAYLRERGLDVIVCHSVEEVAAALVDYGVPHKRARMTA